MKNLTKIIAITILALPFMILTSVVYATEYF